MLGLLSLSGYHVERGEKRFRYEICPPLPTLLCFPVDPLLEIVARAKTDYPALSFFFNWLVHTRYIFSTYIVYMSTGISDVSRLEIDLMQTCIQTTSMPKERDYDNTVLSLRFTSAEAVRFWEIMDAVKARNPYVGKSDVYRELLGLKLADALTKNEIHFFRTGDKTGRIVPVAPRSKSAAIPLLKTHQRKRRVK